MAMSSSPTRAEAIEYSMQGDSRDQAARLLVEMPIAMERRKMPIGAGHWGKCMAENRNEVITIAVVEKPCGGESAYDLTNRRSLSRGGSNGSSSSHASWFGSAG